MTLKTTRMYLLLIFIISLFIIVICYFSALRKGMIYSDDFTSLISETLKIYSVHLAIVLSTIFLESNRQTGQVDKSMFFICIGLVIFWNLLLFVRIALFMGAKTDDPADLLNYLTTVSASSSFLVAGTLTYFFSKNQTA